MSKFGLFLIILFLFFTHCYAFKRGVNSGKNQAIERWVEMMQETVKEESK